ncbi:hypothetical protein SDC9_156145 [bioreactor metagenome]|uniref:Uncharacterized protein n=1 Tax=bioreactor metagenome TaxID=1076179 RepID=A0A645F604_9ZZZZ
MASPAALAMDSVPCPKVAKNAMSRRKEINRSDKPMILSVLSIV